MNDTPPIYTSDVVSDQQTATEIHSWKKHPQFYFDDANLFIKARDGFFVYGVYRGLVSRASEVFADCFKLPPALIKVTDTKQEIEGSIPEYPIIMPVSEGHLEALFSFLFHIGWKDDAKRSTEEFILLGEISQQYIIPDALNYTINNLGYRSYDFEKAQKLYYACKFGVPDWGESATKDILRAYAGVEKTVGDIHLHSNIMTILYAGQSNI
ncbi:hypothetical protein FB446DRAFT_787909 [Lentinula raphanica]|nr:hypothetical protein FB446DRAFT_787909 [Lentinula raphanica]